MRPEYREVSMGSLCNMSRELTKICFVGEIDDDAHKPIYKLGIARLEPH